MKFFHFLSNSSSCLFSRAICLRVSILLLKKGRNLSKVTALLSWKHQKIKYLATSVRRNLKRLWTEYPTNHILHYIQLVRRFEGFFHTTTVSYCWKAIQNAEIILHWKSMCGRVSGSVWLARQLSESDNRARNKERLVASMLCMILSWNICN